MTRPADPSWTVGSWATNANYPAGSDPWSAQPTKVAHPGPLGGFVPAQGAAAEYFNYELNRIYATQTSEKSKIAELLNFIGQVQIQNWPYLESGDKGSPRVWCQGDADFDPIKGLWVSIAYNSASGNRGYTSPTGVTWSSLGDFGNSNTSAAVVVDRDTGKYYATAAGQIGDWDGTTWTMIASGTGRILSTGKWFSSKAVFVGAESGPTTKISTYTTAAGHTNRTVPGTVTNALTWASAVGGSTMLAVPIEHAGANLVGMTTTDGITWTAAAFPTIAAGESIQDVGYGNGVFMIAVSDSLDLTPDTKIYTSATGAAGSWTLVKTLTGKYVNALACTGSLWFASWGADSTSEYARGIFSLDNGATWGVVEGFNNRLSDNVRGRIANNGRQLLARKITGTDMAAVGSFIAGLPGTE